MSYITVEAADIITACLAWREHRAITINYQRDLLIENKMSEKRFWWWQKPYTKEEAIAELLDGDYLLNEYRSLNNLWWGDAHEVTKLVVMASVPGAEFIYLSDKHARIIGSLMPKEAT